MGFTSSTQRVRTFSQIQLSSSEISKMTKGVRIFKEASAKESIPITCYHVSCKSDRPTYFKGGSDLAGVVLYQKGGKNDWYHNGVHCKTGYIIIKRTKNIAHIKTKDGSAVHGKLFKSVFGEDPSNDVIRGGFARVKNEWKFNSWSCNAQNNKWTDDKKAMKQLESQHVLKAVKAWIEHGKQNRRLKSTLYINPNE